MEIPPDVSGHLDMFRDGLLAAAGIRGLRRASGHWRRLTYRPGVWLQDRWVDLALVTLARSAAVMRDGGLITKSQAMAGLADFGVP